MQPGRREAHLGCTDIYQPLERSIAIHARRSMVSPPILGIHSISLSAIYQLYIIGVGCGVCTPVDGRSIIHTSMHQLWSGRLRCMHAGTYTSSTFLTSNLFHDYPACFAKLSHYIDRIVRIRHDFCFQCCGWAMAAIFLGRITWCWALSNEQWIETLFCMNSSIVITTRLVVLLARWFLDLCELYNSTEFTFIFSKRKRKLWNVRILFIYIIMTLYK